MTSYIAYLDESGTHQGAGVSVMAGFVGDERQWRKFEKRSGKLFKRYRVNIFHTIDVRRGDADFENWTVDRKLEFLDELQHIVNETLLAGVTSVLRDVDYAYYTNLDWPKKARRDSKYGILFRGCFAHIIDVIGDIENAYQPTLRVTIEAGHKNAPDTQRIYEWARTRLGPSRALSGLAFADKKSCLPIAAADLLAYSAWGQEVGQKAIGMLKTPSKSDMSYRTNVARVDLNRDSLESLHEQAVSLARA